MSDGDELTAQDFAQIIGPVVASHEGMEPLRLHTAMAPEIHSPPMAATGNEVPFPRAVSSAPGQMALLTPDGEVRPMDDIEAEVIRFAITHYRGQMSEVARRLRIGRSTLYRKLETIDGIAASESEPN